MTTTITVIKEASPGRVYDGEGEAEASANQIREELNAVLARHGVTAALVTFAVFHRGGGDVVAIPKGTVLGTVTDIAKLLNATTHAAGSALQEIEDRRGRS